MSWTNFLIVIFIVYLVYYLLNLLFDLFLSPRLAGSETEEDEVFLTETYAPELISLEEKIEQADAADTGEGGRPASSISSGPISSSGGVGLKQLFSLAKDNLIEHTRAIPY